MSSFSDNSARSVNPSPVLHNGQQVFQLKSGTLNTFKTTAGSHYRVLQNEEKEALRDGVIAKRIDNDLHLRYTDATEVQLQDFFAESNLGQCDFMLPTDQGSYLLNSVSALETYQDNGSQIAFEHGNTAATPGMISPATEAPAPHGFNMLEVFTYGGIAAAASGGIIYAGVKGSSPATSPSVTTTPPVKNTVSGVIVAGPVIENNGLIVNLYDANGKTLLGSSALDANGFYSIDIGDYNGALIAKLLDDNSSPDFIDEATGLPRDISANLMAMSDISSNSTTVNLNALTTLAALKAGVNYGAAQTTPLTVQDVVKINTVVANAFGLTDLVGGAITTTVDAGGQSNTAFKADALTQDMKYGAVLAALSGMDALNTGSANPMQETIDFLANEFEISYSQGGGTGAFNPAAMDALMNGAAIAALTNSGEGQNGLTGIISNQMSQVNASVSIDTIATDNIVNALEPGVAITGTTVVGANVVLKLGGVSQAATVNGEAWSYTLTPADIAAMGQGGETIQAIATLPGDITASASRSIVIDTLAPVAVSVPVLAGGKTGNFTNTFTPILTGVSEVGSQVRLYADDSLNALVGKSVTDTNGSWSITTSSLSEGTHTVAVQLLDAAGNLNSAGGTITFVIDTVAPAVPVINSVTSDDLIDANEQTGVIGGTAEAGATIALSMGGNTRTITADASGNWKYSLIAADITAMGQGAETLSATATDAAGNIGAAGTRAITVDTLPPAPPAAVTVANADNSMASEAVNGAFTVNAEAGSLVKVTFSNGANSLEQTFIGTGAPIEVTLTIIDLITLGDGTIKVVATATDAVGNVSEAGTSSFVLDTVAPDAPVIYPVENNNIVSRLDNLPGVGGTTEANSTVALSLGGNTYSLTADSDGNWRYQLLSTDIAAMGEGSETIIAIATDVSGNISLAGTREISVNTAPPALTISDIAISADTGTSATDFITHSAAQTIMGKLSAALTAGDVLYGSTNNGSTWVDISSKVSATAISWSDATLSGNGNIAFKIKNAVGNSSVATGSVEYVLDVLSPTVAIAGDLSAIKAGQTATVSFTFSENPGATFTDADLVSNGGTLSGFSVNSQNPLAYTATFTPTPNLISGSASVSILPASYSDAAGNGGSGNSLEIKVDTLAPEPLGFNPVDDTNILPGGNLTISFSENIAKGTGNIRLVNDSDKTSTTIAITSNEVNLSGNMLTINPATDLLSGKPYHVEIDNGAIVDLAGNHWSGINNATQWNFIASTPAINLDAIASDNRVSALEGMQTIAIGGLVSSNDATVLAAFLPADFTVTLTPQGGGSSVSVVVDTYNPQTGAWGGSIVSNTLQDGKIYDVAVGILGTAGGAKDITAATRGQVQVDLTTPAAPTMNRVAADDVINAGEVNSIISGTNESGAAVKLSFGGQVRNALTNGTDWSYALTAADVTAMGQGDEGITVNAIDAAGNKSAPTARLISIDTLVPDSPTVVLAVDTGHSSSDRLTNNASLKVTRTESMTSLQYSTDNSIWTGSFIAIEGSNTVYVRQTDFAGNLSASNSLTFVLDRTLPVTPTPALTTDTGISSTDKITNNGTLSVGNLEASATVQYSTNNSTWTNSFNATEGGNTVYVRQTDVAGNMSLIGSAFTFTLDTIAPTTQVKAMPIAATQLYPAGQMNGQYNDSVQIAAVGMNGDYAVTWSGTDTGNDRSIFVQKFNADGTVSGSQVMLEATGVSNFQDIAPQIIAVGTTGAYVVTWEGWGTTSTASIFVQHFNASGATNGVAVKLDGVAVGAKAAYGNAEDQVPQIAALGSSGEYVVTYYSWFWTGGGWDTDIMVQKFDATGTPAGSAVVLDGSAVTGGNRLAQVAAVGVNGDYAVAFQGGDSTGDQTIFVQKFNANGTVSGSMVSLDGIGVVNGIDANVQLVGVGTSGEYVLTWEGIDSAGDQSIFVQHFNATGTVKGNTVQLEATGVVNGADGAPQIVSVGTAGEYVVTWHAVDSANDYSIFVQRFNANGSLNGSATQLEAAGVSNREDYNPQIAALGSGGEFALTWQGIGSNNSWNIYVQRFNADGSLKGSAITLEGVPRNTDAGPQIAAIGNNGAFAVTWTGVNSSGYPNIYVQKFNADGSFSSDISLSSDTGFSNSDFISNTAAQTINAPLSAALLAGETLQGSVDGGATWSNITGMVNGTTVIWTGATLSGSNSIQFKVMDAAGNTGPVYSKSYVLDSAAPTQTVSAVDVSADTGTSATDFITNTASQTITGTLSAVLAGGDKLYGSLDNGASWKDISSSVTGTAINWTGVVLSAENGTILFNINDIAGNSGAITGSQTYVLDTVAPAQTVSAVNFSADTGTSATDLITNTVSQTITGTLSAASAAGDRLYGSLDNGATWTDISNTVTGTAINWTGVTLAGSATILFKVTDAAGNTGAVTGSQVYVLDTVAPTQTVSAVDISADSGISATDFLTNTSSQTITGTLSAVLASGEILYGSTNNGTTWTDISSSVTGTVISWTGATLSGRSAILFKISDAAGNTGATAGSQSYELDTIMPVQTVSAVDISADTGTSASDFITNIANQTITGTLSAALAAGDKLYGSLDNGTTWIDISSSVTGTAISWVGATLAGSSTIVFKVSDAAGNDSATTGSQAYVLDNTAPVISTLLVSGDDKINSSDTRTAVALSGITTGVENNQSITVSIGGVSQQLTVTNNTFSGTVDLNNVADTAMLAVTANVSDAAGNAATQLGKTVVMDTIVPAQTVSVVDISADTGSSATDFITNTAGQTITGTLSAALATGEILYGSSNNGTSWTDISNSVTGTAISWTGATLAGSSTIVFKVADAAGNTGATTGSQAYVLDTIAPMQIVSAVDISTDTGSSATDFITSTASQTITGTLSAALATGEILYGSSNNGTSWTDISNSVTGTAISWTGATLAGSGTILFKISDVAGNASATTGSQVYVLDTIVPAQTVSAVDISADTGSSATDFITNSASQTITGTLSAALATGEILHGSSNNGTSWTDISNSVTGTAISWTGATLAGSSTIVFKVTDAVENAGVTTGSQAYVLDTIAPMQIVSAVDISSDTGNSATDFITNTAAQTITGTLSAALATGEILYGSSNNGTSWTDISNSVAGTAISWTGASLADSSTIVFKVVDAAGNTGAMTGSQAYVLDTVAPTTQVKVMPIAAEQLYPVGQMNGQYNDSAQISAVGTNGDYVVTWSGNDTGGDRSVFVQKFNANGTTAGNQVMLEATGITASNDLNPQISAVGNSGAYVIVWDGRGTTSTSSIFVQHFIADGTTNGSATKLDGVRNPYGNMEDERPQITALGTAGEYVVTYHSWFWTGGGYDTAIMVQKFDATGVAVGSVVMLDGYVPSGGNGTAHVSAVGTAGAYVVAWQGGDSGGDETIFVQKFNATGTTNGTIVSLEANGVTNGNDNNAQLTAVGTTGEYAVTWQGVDSAGDQSIFVQHFNVDGTVKGGSVQLEAIGNSTGIDQAPQIAAVGSSGEYVVTWVGADSTGDLSIYVQRFNANGSLNGSATLLEAIGVTNRDDNYAQITALGTAGEYAVTWAGIGTNNSWNIYVQRFNTDGSFKGNATLLEGYAGNTDTIPQITALGSSGAFAVTWTGYNYYGYPNIYVQKFNADGSISRDISLSADTGSSANDFITNTAAQTISAPLSAALVSGETLHGSLDGGQIWTDITSMVSGASVTWTGVTLSGSNSIQFKVMDAAGNAGPIYSQAYVLDTLAPTKTVSVVSLSADTGNNATDFITNAAAQTITGTLSAALVSGETLYGSVNNGTTWTDISSKVSSTSITWTGATLSGSSNILFKITDTAGNSGTTTGSQVYVLDTVVPTQTVSAVDISSDTGNSATDFITNTAAQTITGTLSATLVTGEILYGSSNNGMSWTDISNSVTGTAISWTGASLAGSSTILFKISDLAGNAGATTGSQAYVLDTAAPTVIITDDTAGSARGAVTYTYTFSRAVTGFDATDVTISAGTKGNFTTIDSSHYTLVVTPPATGSGTITTDVAAGAATDSAGNSSLVATQNSQAYTPPPQAGDAVIDLGGSYGKLIAPVQVEGNWYYYWDINGNGTSTDDYSLAVPRDLFKHDFLDGIFNKDINGVVGGGGNTTDTYRYGTINGINLALPTAGGPSGSPYGANGLGQQQPGTVVSLNATTDNPTYNDLLAIWDAYNGTGTATTNDGVPTGWLGNGYWSATPTANGNHAYVNLNGSLVRNDSNDTNGNLFVAVQVVFPDTLAPTVASIALTSVTGIQSSTLNAGDVVHATVTMSEATTVTGTPQLALNIGGTTVQANYVSGSGTTALVFDYIILANQTDANGISVAANSLTLNGSTLKDAAGNVATLTHALLADNAGYLVDTTVPTVSATTATIANTANATVQSSETGTAYLVKSTVTVNALADITGAVGSNWNSATITIANTNTNLPATGLVDGTYKTYATDAAGNLSAVSTNSVTIDTTAPTVTITDDTAGSAKGTVTYTYTFSEAVTGFDATDVVLSAGTKGTFTAVSGSQYTLVVTPPTGSGTITMDIAAGAATDSAGNSSAVATQSSQAYAPPQAGDAVIDLGGSYGKLIKPVNVDGNWYYFWDRSGNGVADGGMVTDTATHDQLDALFTQDVTGVSGGGGNTTDTYRYATLNGIQLALPSLGWTGINASPNNTAIGNTAIPTQGDTAINSTYNDLAAIWDAFNANSDGTPSGWINDEYWSATVGGAGHLHFHMINGWTTDRGDTASRFVVLQVLPPDTTAPTVSSIALTSATGIQSSTLNAGDVVHATVTMTEATTVTGTPQLALNIGGTTVQASYVSGSGTTALVFDYTILANQTDANGISVAANSLTLNGGTLKDAASNNATLSNALLTDNAGYSVDTAAPTVTITDNQAGSASGAITFTFAFSEAVTGFDATDVVLSAGTKGTFTAVSSSQYTLVVTPPTGSGTITANVAAGAATDTASNLSVVATQNSQVYATSARAGNAVIDLGGSGKLISPIQVEGKWYYYWDISGDGTTGGADGVNHISINSTFNQDVNGNANPNAATTGTTDVYRYATINGIKVALPTYGYTVDANGKANPNFGLYANGTAVTDGTATNATYNDVLAVWDAYNGSSTLGNITGLVPAWGNIRVWSSTPVTGGHVSVDMNNGYVYPNNADTDIRNVMLEVLPSADVVSSVSITSATGALANTLTAGDVLHATVTMSEVTTVTGTPQLGLNIGGTTVQASYASGSGTSTLVFDYIILANQLDINGVSIDANSLALNSGTLKDAAGNSATLTHTAAPDNANFMVANTAKIDLTGSGNNTMKLTLADVIDIGSNNIYNNSTGWNGIASGMADQMAVTGNAGDVVQLVGGASWTKVGTVTETATTHVFDVYNSTSTGQLLIDQLLTYQAV